MIGRAMARAAVAILGLVWITSSEAQTLRPQGGSIRPVPESDSPITRSPTGPPPWRPTGPAPWNPTGREPLGTSRSRPTTIPEPVVRRAPGAVVATIEDRGVTVPVSASFYCQAHDRGFGGRDRFAQHVEQLHGVAVDAVAGALVDDGGILVLPAR